MTGDDIEDVPDQTTDAVAAAPAQTAAPAEDAAAVILTDAERAVPDFEVPAPPSFDDAPNGLPAPPPASLAAAADLPVPPAAAAEPVIPPPPVFDNSLRDAVATASPERRATRRAAQRSDPVPRAAVSYVDVASSSAGTDERNSYRAWSVVIYAGLTLLFLGAIGMMGFLAFSG